MTVWRRVTSVFFAFLIVAMYLITGVQKLISPVADGKKVARAAPWMTFLLPGAVLVILAGILEVICSVMIMTGAILPDNGVLWRIKAVCAYLLAAFTVLVTFVFYFPFFKVDDGKWKLIPSKYYPFLSNTTATGALLLLSRS